MKNKILVISNCAFCNENANGRTLIKLLSCFPSGEKAQFFIHGNPDFNVCHDYYRVSDKDALNSFIKRKKIDGSKITKCDGYKDDTNEKKIGKTPFKMLLREIAWKFGAWKNKHLTSWLNKINPTVIFLFVGDNRFLLDFARKIAKNRNIPIVVYSTEEYQFKNYNYVTKRFSLFYYLWLANLKKGYKKLQKYVKVGLFNSEDLKDLYAKTYSYKCLTCYQKSDIDFIDNSALNDEIRISYLGNLGLNRHKALMEIANSLALIDKKLKLDIYGKASYEVEEELKANKNIVFHSFVSYDKVVEIIHNSTLVIHAEFSDKFYNRDLKYAFSTKITDSVCSGTPFFVYAPTNLACTSFLIKNKCAFVATSSCLLVEKLTSSLFDLESRQEVVKNAKVVKEKFFTENGQIKEFI